MALYVEKDVDLVRTLEAVVCAEMLACLDHLVVLELVRIRLLACLPLTETYERANQESTRLQVSAIGSKVASHCEKKMTGWLFTRCTRSSYSSTVVRRLARRARVHARPSFVLLRWNSVCVSSASRSRSWAYSMLATDADATPSTARSSWTRRVGQSMS